MWTRQLLKVTLFWARLGFISASASASTSPSSILFEGGTIIAFNRTTEALEVIRNGSLLVTGDRIAGIFSAGASLPPLSARTERVDVTGKIISPGFVDTHRHGWQTGLKTLASNTSLVEYYSRYSEYAAAGVLTPDDVYIGQLAGLYESLNAGVTTTLDHAHHTWSNATAEAGLRASIHSTARVFWAYTFHNVSGFEIPEQLGNFRDIATKASFRGSATSLGIAYDDFGRNPNAAEVRSIIDLAEEFNVSVITTHSVQGLWGLDNAPEDFEALGILNSSIPIVFSHASYLTPVGAQLLRANNQYISITPESEMHYGHTHPESRLIQDQASLGVDTHLTFSTDLLTQARLWLQVTRRQLYAHVLNDWRVPANNPMSAYQAFMLATRHGGLALRRGHELGILAAGAKADLVVWDAATSPALLGWIDPVAAIILHASVADIEHVLVDGVFRKRDFRLTNPEYYTAIQDRLRASAARIRKVFVDRPLPVVSGTYGGTGNGTGGFEYSPALTVDTLRGPGNGYGDVFWT
ncbi:amidohydrolase [Podospora didyma]|uniref:Amidohydrolase n=1 Tax=Podospora didyma TaxID=330526 RepID=A0AAE0KEM3_9PEZI|nr:amidohydrolase [Podospora didyma]